MAQSKRIPPVQDLYHPYIPIVEYPLLARSRNSEPPLCLCISITFVCGIVGQMIISHGDDESRKAPSTQAFLRVVTGMILLT